ncbi:MAG: GNAT family N-acetyltransferase, partial [Gemmatimonadales bacterium]
DHQGAGYASEAVAALSRWAFSHPEVSRVIAETYPELGASRRVLERNEFRLAGSGSEERLLRFELARALPSAAPPSDIPPRLGAPVQDNPPRESA